MRTAPLDSFMEDRIEWVNRGGQSIWHFPMGNPSRLSQAVPQGGALDEEAALMGNYLVGNAPDSPVLECALQGPVLHLKEPCVLALTGMPGKYLLGKEKLVLMNQSLHLPAGSHLDFRRIDHGGRLYIALAPHHTNRRSINRPVLIRRKREQSSALQFTPGPEWNWLDAQAQNRLITGSHRILPNSNRMGLRLDAAIPTDCLRDREMLSSGVMPGTIQLTPQGQLIILLKDAQTTGGYPRIGQMTLTAQNALAQKPLGRYIALTTITQEEANMRAKWYLNWRKDWL